MKTKHFLRMMAVVLVALLAGSTTALADWQYQTTADDSGGGSYDFRSEMISSANNFYAKDLHTFTTSKSFDINSDQIFYEFSFCVFPAPPNPSVPVAAEVEAYIAPENGSRLLIGKATMDYAGNINSSVENRFIYGPAYFLSPIRTYAVVQYLPTSDVFTAGAKSIVFRCRYVYNNRYAFGWFEYEKKLDLSSVTEDNPMPRLQYEWNDQGKVGFKAVNAPDKRSNPLCAAQYYGVYTIWTGHGNTERVYENFGTTSLMGRRPMTVTTRSNNKMDLEFSSPGGLQNVSYTIPVFIEYQGGVNYNDEKSDGEVTWIQQPSVKGILKPFIRPTEMKVDFNTWNRSNTIQWTRNSSETGWDGRQNVTVDCRTDGTWYVIRYEQGQSPADYVVVGTLNGNADQLQMTDDDIEYDKTYIYRVVFLPSVISNTFKNSLVTLPAQPDSKYDLWRERSVNTTLEMPIKLAQDRTFTTAVRLVWEYCIEPTGQNWTIEFSPQGANAWRTLDNSLNVDPTLSKATFDTDGSVCDLVDYRVKTTYMERDFYSNVVTCNLPAGSYISEVKASTGTEEKTVIVKWKVESADANNDIKYRVLRRAIGTDEWTVLTDEIHGTASEYTYTDDRVMAGSYYEYTVEAYGAKCEEQLVKTDAVIAPGFSQARGTITGHISFGSGTPVAGVRVNLVKSSADESTDQPQFLSRYIEGEGKGLQWTADADRYQNDLNGQKELTLQLWAKKQHTGKAADGSSMLLHLANALELGVKTTGDTSYLYAIDCSQGGTAVKEFPSLVLDHYDFSHVAAVYKGGTWTFYVGNDTLRSATMTAAGTEWNICQAAAYSLPEPQVTLSIGGSNRTGGSTFTGFVDDVRLWKRALTEEELNATYTRILGGTESGLILYWPLDEGIGIKDYAFDVARQDGIYQLNHPDVGVNARPSATVPNGRLLALYGLTDTEGDYIIKGIPFQQGGTNYKLTPALGIHEFNPNTRSMFVSPTSLTANNIDFEDVSSFPMSGHIYYAGTNIPAEGIQFYVDGDLVTANGKLNTTDSDGFYSISVPIGEHYVEARLDGHTMVSGGRFPTQGTYNFERAVQYNFTDSTLVNFVGRIGGGVRNDTLAVGFGESRNNIGTATIQLRLNNESFSFNCKDDFISDATSQRTWDSDTTSIRSTAWTGIGSDAKYINIKTDPRTGEFSALLPPLKYVTRSIRIDSNPNVDFNTLPEIDLTNVKKELRDSLKQAKEFGDSVWNYYTYNTKLVKSYFAEPQVTMQQVKGDGAYGEKEMKDYAVSSTEKADISDIWVRQANGDVSYTYGFPVFARHKEYTFAVHGFEVYTNYDSGQAVADTIPMNGQVLTVANEMSDEQDVVARVIDPSVTDLKEGDIYNLKWNQVRLDSVGRNEITFTTGTPNITAPYTRQFSIVFERNKRTYTGPMLNGVVLGELTNGNNFVTAGPDHVDMVLRDPPGAKGKTTWKTGRSYTTIESKVDGIYWDQTAAMDLVWGANLKTVVGLGVAIVSSSKAETLWTVGIKSSFSWLWKDDKTYVYTEADNISTGTGSKYVGANGDVFIGKSHNFIIGTCRKLGFHREANGIVLALKDAVSINDSITTDFMYSALEIKQTMLPKLEETRNMLLEYMDSVQAKSYVNTTDQDVYLTWLQPGDPNYGKEGTYEWKRGINGQSQDMVLHYNESMRLWRERLRENELDKIEAFNDRKYYKENRSFDGSVSYTYSERRDTTLTSTYQETAKAGFSSDFKTSFSVNSGATFGTNVNFKEELGYTGSRLVGDSLDNTKSYAEFAYDLIDGNTGTDFTVDIYRSPRGWGDIFLLRGGQSYNPYEGLEYAEYYEPEKKHVISYGTEQMEQPAIAVSTDGAVGAKSAVLTDVPAGQTGQFTLHLSNNNHTHQPMDMTYNLSVQEHTDSLGLEILMDGVPVSGRSVWVPAGETVKKIITVRQTDQSRLDYKGVKIRFQSQYQPLKIYDEVSLDISFKPSSSPVDLLISDPVLNIETLARNEGNLEMKVTNFDRQFRGMTRVGVEYRYEGSTTWAQPSELTFLVNRSDSANAGDRVLPATGDLRLNFNMSDDNMYPQGTYTFRAYTETMYGTDPINVYSSEVTVVKDNVRPRNLTTPLPANGILRYGDDLVVEFNEDIVPGYVSDKNIIVTAKLNDQPVAHDVAKLLLPFGEEQMTLNPIFLNGDFSVDFWMKWEDSGSILRLGSGQFALSVDDSGHIIVTMGQAQQTSRDVVPKGEWTYIVLSYKSSEKKFSALALHGDTTLQLFTDQTVDDVVVQQVHYSDDNYLYLGNMHGAIHDLALFNIYRNVTEAAATKNQTKDNYVYGLANYWPMKEGHGHVATDTRHTHDFVVNNSWLLDNKNYALRLDDEEGVEADISRINTGQGDSYAIELWVHPAGTNASGEQTVFETGSNDSNRLRLYINQQQDWMLRYGGMEQVVASNADFADKQTWNHVALNVVRGQAASFYFNGQRTAVIAERDVPSLEGSRLILGKGMAYLSTIDEVRIWHAALSESRLLANQYNCIDTTDVYSRGLVAYYPFEKAGTENGVSSKVSTLENMAPAAATGGVPAAITPQGQTRLIGSAPPLKNAPVESRIIAKPVASERKIVIRLEEGSGIKARDIEGCTLNVTVDKIHDMHGNESKPIRWTTYVQLNTLKWMKDSVNIVKQYGDDYTFDVNIENRGGNTEYYTLYNMPQWLTLIGSERTDDVDPLKTKTLRFRVNPLVAVGNYDVTIGLQGNNEILEPLRIVMKVQGQKPAWSVNANDYENNMSIVGQVYVNGILMGNGESLVAAFIGDECRGVASPKQMRGAAYVAMSVYGTAQKMVNGVATDLDKGQDVTFRIWDATTGMTYTNVNITMPDSTVTDVIIFDPSKSYGNFDHPVIFTKSNLMEQQLNIKSGWNWLALGVEPATPTTSVVFKDVVTWSAQLKDQGTGVAYSRGNYWAGSLKEVHANTMYKLQLTRLETSNDLPAPLTVNGEQVRLAETPVKISGGWNWIAYTPLTTMPIGTALAGANPKVGDQLKSQNGFSYYGPYGWEGNLEALESGRGYLYHSTDTVVKQFVYPSGIENGRLRNSAARSQSSSFKSQYSIFNPVSPTDYPDNMAIVILLTADGEPIADAELGAFVDGECRGIAFVDEAEGDLLSPLYYLLVAGEGSGQPMEIRANIGGKVMTVCNTLTYTSDGSIGTPWEPFVIDINDLSGIKSIDYSTMVDGVWYTPQGIRYGTKRPTTAGVYLYNGQKVVIKPRL